MAEEDAYKLPFQLGVLHCVGTGPLHAVWVGFPCALWAWRAAQTGLKDD